MNLTVYSIKDRVQFVQLLSAPQFSGLTVSEIKEAVSKSIAEERAELQKTRRPAVSAVAAEWVRCPYCRAGKIVKLKINDIYIDICVTKRNKAGCGHSRMVT